MIRREQTIVAAIERTGSQAQRTVPSSAHLQA